LRGKNKTILSVIKLFIKWSVLTGFKPFSWFCMTIGNVLAMPRLAHQHGAGRQQYLFREFRPGSVCSYTAKK